MVTNHDTVANIFGRPSYWEARAAELDAALAQERAARAAAEAVIAQVRDLHCVEIRYSEDDGETSQDTPTDEPCTVFEVCSECGRIEMEYAADYRESLWPCPTAKILASALLAAHPEGDKP